MGLLDWLFGSGAASRDGSGMAGRGAASPAEAPARSEDEIALERYRYLLRTAPPERIEAVHEEAFAQLSPNQRRMLFEELSANAPSGEAPRGDDPRSLAQSATRAEIRQPGTLERTMGGLGQGAYGGGMGGGYGGGMGAARGGMLGGGFASTVLGTVTGYVIGSTIMHAFLPPMGWGGEGMYADGYQDGYQDGQGGDGGQADGGQGDGGWTSDGGFRVGGGEAAGDGGGGFDFGGGGFDLGGGDFGGGFDF